MIKKIQQNSINKTCLIIIIIILLFKEFYYLKCYFTLYFEAVLLALKKKNSFILFIETVFRKRFKITVRFIFILYKFGDLET